MRETIRTVPPLTELLFFHQKHGSTKKYRKHGSKQINKYACKQKLHYGIHPCFPQIKFAVKSFYSPWPQINRHVKRKTVFDTMNVVCLNNFINAL